MTATAAMTPASFIGRFVGGGFSFTGRTVKLGNLEGPGLEVLRSRASETAAPDPAPWKSSAEVGQGRPSSQRTRWALTSVGASSGRKCPAPAMKCCSNRPLT